MAVSHGARFSKGWSSVELTRLQQQLARGYDTGLKRKDGSKVEVVSFRCKPLERCPIRDSVEASNVRDNRQDAD